MRRDIDTRNDKLLMEMSAVEKFYDINCSYYFRWSTFNPKIIDYISSNGSEVSYHYEEIATFAKQKHIKMQNEIQSNIEEIRKIFRDNYIKFKELTGLPCKTVASHGEWINRALKIANYTLLNDKLRQDLGIIRETHDQETEKYVTYRNADQNIPIMGGGDAVVL